MSDPIDSGFVVEDTIAMRARWKFESAKGEAVRHWRNFCDWLKWLGHKPGRIETYAREELRRAGWFDEDAMYGDMMPNAVLAMARQFADEGHSGMSASIAVALFKDVAMFKPLTPLTGDDDEWSECGEGVFQNKRCSHVFRENGQAYDIEGRIFREPDGCCYTSRDSRVDVEFPYTPTREYVDVPAPESVD